MFSLSRARATQTHTPPGSAGQQRQVAARAFKLKGKQGEITVDKATFLIGSGATADLKLKEVSAEHAELKQKGKQVFLKALVGESVFDRTSTWIDGNEARPNVSYVLASGSQLAFGAEGQSYSIEFEEPSGANPLVELMMQGLAAGASPEVRKALDGGKQA